LRAQKRRPFEAQCKQAAALQNSLDAGIVRTWGAGILRPYDGSTEPKSTVRGDCATEARGTQDPGTHSVPGAPGYRASYTLSHKARCTAS